MGLKIYNGFRMPMMDTHGLHAWAQTVRAKAHKVHDRLFLRWAAETATHLVDAAALAGSLEAVKDRVFVMLPEREVSMTSSVGGQAVWSCHDWEKEYAKSPDRHEHDLGASMVVFPAGEHLLAWLFAERAEYGRAIRGLPGVERYDFWYGDPPSGITQHGWKQRGEDWEAALSAGPTPSQAGLTIELTSGHIFLPELGTVARYTPSWSRRVRTATERLIAKERPKPHQATRASIVKLLQWVRAWDASPEGVAVRGRVQEAVERRLPRRIGLYELGQSPAELFERFRGESA